MRSKKRYVVPSCCKVKILQTLAKAAGLLEPESSSERPSVVGIKMVGPKEITDVDIKKDE